MQGRKEFFKGTSRKSRYRKALSPDYAQVDERTLPNLLNYAVDLARNVPFFDPNKTVKTNWDEFFSRNDLVQLIEVSTFQVDQLEKEIHDEISRLYVVHDRETLIRTLNNLSYVILLIAQAINNLKKNLSINAFTSDLIYDISNSINGELKDLVIELCTYEQVLQWSPGTLEVAREVTLNWGISTSGSHPQKEVNEATIDRFKEIFHAFFYAIKHLMKKSSDVLNRFLNDLQNAEPHIALYLVFLKLFRYLQDFQNRLTERHLDFYYREVLQLNNKGRTPDRINISVQLKPGIPYLFLPKKTALLAGKDENGKKILYQTDQDCHLSAARVVQLNTIFLSKAPEYGQSIDQFNYTGIFCGRAPQLTGKNTWAAFGEDQYQKPPGERTLNWARLGWIIDSPCLYLEEGVRRVDLAIKCSPASFSDFRQLLGKTGPADEEKPEGHWYKVLSTAFLLGISTAEGILNVEHYSCTINPKISTLQISFTLSTSDPAVTRTPVASLPGDFPPVSGPFVQVVLNENCSLNLYSLLQLLQVEDILLNVSVRQSNNLKLYNNYGELLLNSPVQLFGAIPENDSYLLIGHQEALQKNLTSFELKVQWYQLPVRTSGINRYFEGYDEPVHQSDYRLKAAFLKNHGWVPAEEEQPVVPLFEENPVEEQETKGIIASETSIRLDLRRLAYRKEVMEEPYQYTSKTKGGFFRLQLKCPKIAFGHSTYARKLSEVVLANARLKKGQSPLEQPNVPFSPVISQAECSYTARSVASKNPGEIRLFQLAPFGHHSVELKSRSYPVSLLTPMAGKGACFLGLDQYPEEGQLSLLFQMKESFYEEVKGEVPKVSWHYLCDNQWQALQDDEVIEDSTHGFLHDGIIRLHIPEGITRENTLMPPGLLWLKAQIERGAVIRGHLSGIFENAVSATWDGASDGTHLQNLLPAHTISGPEIPVPEISGILQPHRSYGGRTAETTEQWTLRVSERLRHKNRAINAKDFEELILDRFDLIFKAQCFMAGNHIKDHRTVSDPHLPPGKVHVVVVPDVTSDEIKDKLYPRLKGFKLMEIRDYLKTRASPFVQIEVSNPYYEPVRVHADVKFDEKQSNGFYLNQLNVEITQFLSSWLSSDIKEEEFGASIYKSDVLGFIQNRPYVRFVTEFSLVRIDYVDPLYEMYDSARSDAGEEEIMPKFPWSIITSARQHDLRAIDGVAYQPPVARGIGNMKLESDFLLD